MKQEKFPPSTFAFFFVSQFSIQLILDNSHHNHIHKYIVHKMRNHMGNEAKSLLMLWNEIQYQNCARSGVISPHNFPFLSPHSHTSPRVNLIRFYNWLLFEMNLFSSHIIISHVVPCHESEPSASVWGGNCAGKLKTHVQPRIRSSSVFSSQNDFSVIWFICLARKYSSSNTNSRTR